MRGGFLVSIFLLPAALCAHAADVISTWDGTANNWTSNHWSSPTYPNNVDGGPTYDAIISAGTVALDQDITIQKFTLSGSNSGLSGSSQHFLTINEQFDWTGATLGGAVNTTTIAPGATFNLANTASAITLGQRVVNNGTANWTGTLPLTFASGQLENNGTFTVNVASSNTITGTTIYDYIANYGTFTKKGSGAATISGMSIDNYGLIDVQAGTLNLESTFNTGDITGAAGATLNLTNSQYFSDTADITGGLDVTFSGEVNENGQINTTGALTFNGFYSKTMYGPVSCGSVTVSTGTSGTTFSKSLTVTGAINVTSGYLYLNGATSASALNLSAGAVRMYYGSLTTTNGTMSGGTLEGNDWTVTGTLNWTNGTMFGSGQTTIGSGGTLNLAPVSSSLKLNRNLTSNGTINYTGSQGFTFKNATLRNNGTFNANLSDNAVIEGTGTFSEYDAFINAGTFTKQDPFTLTFYNIAFNNNRNVNIQAGTLDLPGGGTHTGDFTGAAGTTLQLGGIHTFDFGSDITGDLNVVVSYASVVDNGRITTTGTLDVGTPTGTTFNGPITASSLLIGGGTHTFNSSITAPGGSIGGTFTGSASWHVTSTLNWSGGQIAGTGTLFIDSGATLNASGSSMILGRKLTNNGSTIWTGGTLSASNSTFQNNGVFTADSSSNQSYTRSAGTNVFNNAGTFVKKNTGTTTFTNVTFNNTGTIDLKAGRLNFTSATFSQSSSGVVKGSGILQANVQNFGTIAPGSSPGVLTIDGNYTQMSTGVLQIEIGGNVRGDQYDALLVTGIATLGGALNVSLLDNFTPTAGAQFDVFDWGTRSGTFATLQLAPLPSGLTWNTSQLYTTGVLQVVPEPNGAALLLIGSAALAIRARKKAKPAHGSQLHRYRTRRPRGIPIAWRTPAE